MSWHLNVKNFHLILEGINFTQLKNQMCTFLASDDDIALLSVLPGSQPVFINACWKKESKLELVQIRDSSAN